VFLLTVLTAAIVLMVILVASYKTVLGVVVLTLKPLVVPIINTVAPMATHAICNTNNVSNKRVDGAFPTLIFKQ
jgi:hypothetical protein